MTQPRHYPDRFQAEIVLHMESAVQALASTSPVAASCLVTVDTNANMADGNVVTINDGFRKVTYEYDKSSNGVAAGNVSWAAGAGTAAQSATTLATAIAGAQPSLTVVNNANGTLTLTNRWPGAGGNGTNTCTSVGTLAITNFTGGVDAAFAATVAATTTQKFHKFESRSFRVDKVTWFTATTTAADAANYWTLELKNGSTSVASWSTLSTAQGALTGGTPAELVPSATDANRVFAVGDIASLVLTKTASPSALPPGRLTIHGRYV